MSTQEIASVREQEAQAAELMPVSLEEQALLTALTPPQEMLDDWRERYDVIIDELVAQQLVPDKKLALLAVADLIAWEWFAKPEEELPDTLAIFSPSKDSGLEPQVICKPQPYLGKGYHLISSEIVSNCDVVTTQRDAYLVSQLGPITHAAQDCLRQSPQYNLLKAFTVEQHVTEQQPLTPFWRQIREKQYESGIKQKFGISPDQLIVHRSPAGLALSKAIERLDFETMPGPKVEKQSAFERVDAWILGEAQQWVKDSATIECNDETAYGRAVAIIMFETFEGSGKMIGVKTTSGHKLLIGERVAGLSAGLCDGQYGTSPYGADRSDKSLTYTFLHLLYSQDQKDVSLALETALSTEAKFVASSTIAHRYSKQRGDAELLLRLRRPKGTIYTTIPENITRDYPKLEQRRDDIYVNDVDYVKRAKSLTAGYVVKPAEHNKIVRLITTQEGAQKYLPQVEQPDLVIDFGNSTEFNPHYGQPFIPGYTVVAQEGGRWYFARASVDPYQSAEAVTLNAEGLDELASQYLEIGLSGLARAIQKRRVVSASDLEDVIRHGSDYTFDTSLTGDSLLLGSDSQPLAIFAQFVRRKRLQLQCSGAASFLGSSLNIALLGGYSRQISGRVLPIDDDRISDVYHAQTLLSYGNDQYILDATPMAPRGLDVGETSSKKPQIQRRFRWPQRAKHTNETSLPNQPSIDTQVAETLPQIESAPTVELSELVAESISENSKAAPVRLEKLLQVAFKTPDRERLYAIVVKLKDSDPIRRALEAVVRYNGTAERAKELRETQRYIDNYQASTTDTLRRLRITQYEPALIQSIAATLAMLN